MYLQITTRCNMTCAHCCFSANRAGTDMSRDTLVQALKLAASMGEMLTVGGGEPTVHPHFFDYLGLTLAYNESDVPVLVVTNGKRKDIALKLSRMARQGVLAVDLSIDDYHDPISTEVVQAFTVEKRRDGWSGSQPSLTDMRGIRTVTTIVPVGRAVEEGLADQEEGCCCETLLVDPEGRVFACGCKKIQLGTIWNPELPPDYDGEWAHSDRADEWLAQRGAERESLRLAA